MPLHSELLAEERNIYPTRFMHSDRTFDLRKASQKSESIRHPREFGNRRGMRARLGRGGRRSRGQSCFEGGRNGASAKAIRDNGSEAITIRADVSREDQVQAILGEHPAGSRVS